MHSRIVRILQRGGGKREVSQLGSVGGEGNPRSRELVEALHLFLRGCFEPLFGPHAWPRQAVIVDGRRAPWPACVRRDDHGSKTKGDSAFRTLGMGELRGRDVMLRRQPSIAHTQGGEEFVGAVDEELGIFNDGEFNCGGGGRHSGGRRTSRSIPSCPNSCSSGPGSWPARKGNFEISRSRRPDCKLTQQNLIK